MRGMTKCGFRAYCWNDKTVILREVAVSIVECRGRWILWLMPWRREMDSATARGMTKFGFCGYFWNDKAVMLCAVAASMLACRRCWISGLRRGMSSMQLAELPYQRGVLRSRDFFRSALHIKFAAEIFSLQPAPQCVAQQLAALAEGYLH